MRRAFSLLCLVLTAGGVAFGRAFRAEAAPARPNILWLVCEDSSVDWIGCYGNPQATTPNIDGLAKQGFRYTHAYACAPVCAPSRSTWITGMFAVSTGTQPMRSRFAIPHDTLPYYPDVLRKAGYYTANFKKTDYNIGGRADKDAWHSFADNAWELRGPGQPFFQVLNFEDSHESRAFGDIEHTRHAPADMVLRRYHPDIPEIRKNYAKYQDAVEMMDAKVGKALERLKQAGLEEDTIVIFNSDHGGVLPRSKRWLYNSGTHAPLIVRIPEKYRHLWPAASPGTVVDRLVSFVDFPKTWLSLAGAEVPERMQGRVFLGPAAEPEPAFVYGFRDRMDERFDSQRSVRSKEFVYIQSAMPNVPWGQTLEYLWKMRATQAWEKAHLAGETNAVTGRFFGPKPVEELYDSQADPDNVVDLAGRPEHAARLAAMRAELRRWQLEVRDSGLLPEGERARRAAAHGLTVYELVRRGDLYPLERYLDARDLALKRDPASRAALEGLLREGDAGCRYWGAYGVLLLVLQTQEPGTKAALAAAVEAALEDACPEVRATAAWVWMAAGKAAGAREAMRSVLRGGAVEALYGLNILDWAKEEGGVYGPELEGLLALEDGGYGGYLKRMVSLLRERKGGRG
jgi:N-sulfoglucosamine sulfohydrolase